MDIDGLIDEHVAPLLDHSAKGIVVGVLHQGARTVRALGAARADGRFDIGSVTKTFTGLLLAEMAERGEVSVDDPIERYLPEGAHAPHEGDRHITLLDLVTHSSGLPRLSPGELERGEAHMEDPYRDDTPEALFADLATIELAAPIGTTAAYSNFGFSLLGTLLGRAVGRDYATALRERVLAPLGLGDTSVGPVADQRKVQGHYEGALVGDWTEPSPGAGGIWSTADGVLTYLSSLMAAATPAARRAQTNVREFSAGRAIAYAWIEAAAPRSHVLWHNGATAGFKSMAMFERGGSTAAVGLANFGPQENEQSLDGAVAALMTSLVTV